MEVSGASSSSTTKETVGGKGGRGEGGDPEAVLKSPQTPTKPRQGRKRLHFHSSHYAWTPVIQHREGAAPSFAVEGTALLAASMPTTSTITPKNISDMPWYHPSKFAYRLVILVLSAGWCVYNMKMLPSSSDTILTLLSRNLQVLWDCILGMTK